MHGLPRPLDTVVVPAADQVEGKAIIESAGTAIVAERQGSSDGYPVTWSDASAASLDE